MVHEVKYKNNQGRSATSKNFMDITDRNRLEQTFVGAHQYLQSIIEIVREPLLILDSDLKVILANRSFYQIFEMEPKKTEGRLIYDLSNRQWDIPKLREFLEEILPRNNTFYDFEVEHKFSGIGQVVLVFNGLRLLGESDEIEIIILAIEDTTRYKKWMEDREESFSCIRETLESTDDGILVVDLEGKIKIFNQRFVELLRIPQHLINSKDYNQVLKSIVDQLSDPESFLTIVNELKDNQDAESFDIIETKKRNIFEYYSKPQRIEEKIVGRVWSFRDITSRKWAENAVKITYISFHNILESSADGIIVVDKNGCMCFFNHAAEIMFQGKVDERVNEMIGFPITGDEIKEIDIKRLNGGPGLAEMRVVETEWEGKSAYLAMLRDITERKHMVEELNRHREHLEEEVKLRTNELIQAEKMIALGQLVSGVAHEVNNPLAFIRSNTEFIKKITLNLKDQLNENDLSLDSLDEIEELIKINIEGINRISLITTALKRFAKPGMEEKSFADINQGIKDTLLIVGNKLKHRINVHEDYCELPKVLCNIERLNQVFMNVILNASEAMDNGNIKIKTYNDLGNVCIEISDDGKGISEDEINKIFDPFFTTKDSGTGLGLSLSYRIVQAHGGNIKVDSQLGKGTKIKISFPMVGEND